MSVRIVELALYRLDIPFNEKFAHASDSRGETSSLWVEVRSHDGAIGCGESCPRDYVTGETLDTGSDFFKRHRASLMESICDVDSLRRRVREHRQEIDHDPAAWCAIELALLDLIAKSRQQSVEAVLGLPELSGKFRYSAVIGNATPAAFAAQFKQYCDFGFTDFKLKLSGKLDEDLAKIALLGQARQSGFRVRVDANNLWRTEGEAVAYLRSLDYAFFAIEEPLPPNQYDEMLRVHLAFGAHIILDESFLRTEQFSLLPPPANAWVINVRVSKMGGLLRSLDVIDQARKVGVPVIIGAQVGETSLLTRAALTVVNVARDVLVAQEGAFGTRLLRFDVCSPSIMFEAAGVLDSSHIVTPGTWGFGIRVSDDRIFRVPL